MKKFFNKLLEKYTKRKVVAVLIAIVVVIALIGTIILLNVCKSDKLDTTYIISRLEESSELTTAKLHYKGISKFNDDGIPFINKSSFIMVYSATARIGIDVSEVKVTADDISDIIWIKIPKAKVLDVKVEFDDIEYFNEKFSLFNVDEKEDGIEAVNLAEKEAEEEIQKMGVLKMADEQAEALIKGLIIDLVPHNYTIKVKE